MKDLNKVAVIIPVYKSELNEYEKISFFQALKVLKDHDIVLVCPDKLVVTIYEQYAEELNKKIIIEFFDKFYFKGVFEYNKLMLSSNFYERFLKYNYLLIYQLDCFVFNNDLYYWINKGYDYIGAPWIFNDRRKWWTLKRSITYRINSLYKRYTNKDNGIYTSFYKVGNGGFSLRKVSTFYKIIKEFEGNNRIEKYRNLNIDFLNAEDIFWGCEVNRYYRKIKIPGYKTALSFSFEINPSLCYDLNNNRLPFGCHAWERYELDFWKPFIEKEGYKIRAFPDKK